MDWKKLVNSVGKLGATIIDGYVSGQLTGGISIKDTASVGYHAALAEWHNHCAKSDLRNGNPQEAATHMLKSNSHTQSYLNSINTLSQNAVHNGMDVGLGLSPADASESISEIADSFSKQAGSKPEYHVSSVSDLHNTVDDKGISLIQKIKAPENQTVLWSGSQNPFAYGSETIDNYYGPEIASYVAREHGGKTLEDTLASNGIILPKWDSNNPESIACWKEASQAFAKNAEGHVGIILGEKVNNEGILVMFSFT